MASSSDRIKRRSPQTLWGKSLIRRAYEQQMKVAEEKDKAIHGEPHDRENPVSGVSTVISDDDITDMADMLISNGLENYESQVAIQTFVKKIDPLKDELIPTVDSSQTVEEESDGRYRAETEINIVDPLFSTRNGKIPQAYVTRVLNTLNPAEAIKLIQKDMKEYVARAFKPDNIKWVGNLLASVAIAWQKRTAPSDEATLREVLKKVIGHEYSHGLIFALPAKDIPQNRKAELEKITFEKYLELVLNEKSLHSSVSMFKNLLKAVRAVRNSPPSEQTADDMLRVMADEMFNDRFSMYMDEFHQKNKLYRDILGVWKEKDAEWMKRKQEHYLFADYGKVDKAEEARSKGQLGAYLQKEGIKISGERLAQLENELAATERAHFFIAKYGDPQWTAKEREFYFTFIQLLRHYDRENIINQFTAAHVESSEPIKVCKNNLISMAHWDVADHGVEA